MSVWQDNLRYRAGHNTSVGKDKNKEVYSDPNVEWLICKKCGAHYGQLGLEPDPFMFVDHLIEIFREVKRVLKPHGNVFVVIDDTYAGGGGWNSGGGLSYKENEWERKWVKNTTSPCPTSKIKHIPRKSLCLVPERFAIKMVDELGFILRQKLIWVKKVLIYKDKETIGNAMPESVKDRNTHTFEFVYHFVKEPKYYYDQLRLPYKDETIGRMERAKKLIERTGLPITPNNKYYQALLNGEIEQYGQAGILTGRFLKYEGTEDFTFAANLAKIRQTMRELGLPECHPLGANAPDVIQINTEPFPEAHFAVFPTKLVEFLIKVGCPEQSIVLDPFGGSGTTALVALQMNRRFILIELNRSYCEIALKRIEPLLKQARLDTFT